jgi:hypothetical protein
MGEVKGNRVAVRFLSTWLVEIAEHSRGHTRNLSLSGTHTQSLGGGSLGDTHAIAGAIAWGHTRTGAISRGRPFLIVCPQGRGVSKDGVTRDGVTRDGVTRDGVTRAVPHGRS